MKKFPASPRYHAALMSMHWLMLLLLVAVYVTMELRGLFPRGGDTRAAMRTWHYMLGLSVFALVWLRLLFKWASPTPPISPPPPTWQQLTSTALQWAFYAFMFAMPLLGWLILSANGKPIPFFGLELPALTSPNKDLASSIKSIHETVATVGYFMLGLHAAAALFHHYFLRDNTLTRMIPIRR